MSGPIIITVPNNYLAMEAVEELESKVLVDLPSPAPSRKRRLDHLTWEEKMQRKKLKNRVAAQTSRDRKKAKMDEMESRIKYFMDMNERLTSEVESLKALNERLLSENATLRSEAAAARSVAAEGRAPDGTPGGAPAAGDVSPLADLLAHFDSDEYLDTLTQLADSLFKEIDANAAGTPQNDTVRKAGECIEGTKVVGSAAEHLESSGGAVVDIKHDVDRILSQHSYAHPYKPETTDTQVQIKEENNDKGDMFYASCDEANDCITIEVPCEEHIVEETPLQIKTDFPPLTDCSGMKLECDMKMLSPMTMSPKSVEENLGLSPSHTILSSDLGYESLASPLSEPESMDLSDFWCESFSELFPGLA
ncbi:unnamed protein product [Spodoptera littoralis]|uniref:X-box-binding protein 1 n=1 Tax=Spodoptera littoralis TaxID=7109 RepID=A0A9P0IES4_SPOLI|nr:unnamed protein product [Spodoptera littoralis]CAH1646274.1 unnamed protein product [Spodoptera littoralis]